METKTVVVPACHEHQGVFSKTIVLAWVCPTCGGPRGETFKTFSYDGSRRLHGVDGWNNPCGHIDFYGDVREEAKINGLNSPAKITMQSCPMCQYGKKFDVTPEQLADACGYIACDYCEYPLLPVGEAPAMTPDNKALYDASLAEWKAANAENPRPPCPDCDDTGWQRNIFRDAEYTRCHCGK